MFLCFVTMTIETNILKVYLVFAYTQRKSPGGFSVEFLEQNKGRQAHSVKDRRRTER